MLSLKTARALREAGLAWKPAQLDFFAIPDRGLDERIFVINDMPAGTADLLGEAIITFDGAVEWALDYVARGEVVWMPSEEQLRSLLAARLAPRLPGGPRSLLTLSVMPGWCRCEIEFGGQPLIFEAADAGEAYAGALLHLLEQHAAARP